MRRRTSGQWAACLRTSALGIAVGLATAQAAADTNGPDKPPGDQTPRASIDFLDTRVIEHAYFLDRVVTPARKHESNPIIADCHSAQTVLRGDDGRLRMWYVTRRKIPGHTGSAREYTLRHAESTDAVTWDMPTLGLKEFDGSTSNNVLLTADDTDIEGREITGVRGAENFCVIDNQRTPGPHTRGRYTALIGEGSFLYSDDGLRWQAYPENPVLDLAGSDTYNNFLFDTGIGRYVLYHRPHPRIHAGHPRANRLVARIESDDLVEWDWGSARCVLDTDGRDAPAFSEANDARGRDLQFYGMTVTQYHGLYLGFANLLNEVTGRMDVRLVHSFDGLEWHREPNDQPFIEATADAWDCGTIGWVSKGSPLAVGDDLHFYYGGTNMTHNYKIMNDEGTLKMRLGLGVVKRGRLVGYHAGAAEGQLLTRPFTLSGRRLTLNVDARGGEVKAALADEEGRAIPGCSMGEAVPIREDGLDVPARWEGRADLTDLVGQRIRLRISAEDAKLYGLSMEDKEADLE